TAPEADETLWCGPTGNVGRDFGSKTAAALIRDRAASITTPEAAADLRRILNLEPTNVAPSLVIKSKTRYATCDVWAVEVNSARSVWLPAWLFLPRAEWKKLLLILEPAGRNSQWHEEGLYPQLAAAGTAVCAADVRGIGDLQPAFGPGAAAYTREHQTEENYAWASLILGRPLLSQRVTDIIAIVGALASSYPRATVMLAARDKLTGPALCAAAVEPRIRKLYLVTHLVSWRSVAESERGSTPLANFAPDLLRHTDLPQIARSIAPRSLVIAGQEETAWNFDTLSRL